MTSFNVLISSAGRRVELMQCFRMALRDFKVLGNVYATDCALTSPACYVADRFWQVPRCDDPEFIPQLLDICIQEDIKLVVPTIDSELGILAACKREFQKHGVTLAVSSSEAVRICADKVATHEWLDANDFPTVRQANVSEVLQRPELWPLPLIAKPRHGSASKGVRLHRYYDELKFHADAFEHLIVQEVAQGDEYTINVYVNSHGKCVCQVPHRRIEVRGGEVSKAVTRKHRDMMRLASEVAERLPDASGMLNVQCFLNSNNSIRIIEINARTGGGYPLAHAAGARFSHWIVQELLTGRAAPDNNDWTDDLAMLRYDQAIIQPASELRSATLAKAVLHRC